MKKDKEILFELESQVREVNQQFADQSRALDTRLEVHLNLVWELVEFCKKRVEVEGEYGKNMEKLARQVLLRHKDNKTKRENWIGYSTYNAWQGIIACAREKGKDHTAYSELVSTHIVPRLMDISDDMLRIHKRCKDMVTACQDDIKKVLNELVKSMKTYHLYHGESQVAESKLLRAQSQRVKVDQQNMIAKKFVNYEKKSEKKQAKYLENKLKSLRARNDYLLNIDTANVAIDKYFSDDFPRLVKKMDVGFQAMASRLLECDVIAHKIIIRNDTTRGDILARGALGVKGPNDYNVFKLQCSRIFNKPASIEFQAHKGDEVSQLSAQKLVQEEMLARLEQVSSRVRRIKEEKEEMTKKISLGEELFFERLKGQPINVEAYFNDTPSIKSPTDKNKDVAIKNEDVLFELYKERLLNENLLHRLQAKHEMLKRALGEGREVDCKEFLFRPPSLPPKPKKKSKTSKSRPKLFGGDIEEYVKETGEHIPNVMKSCIHVINQFGMHHQGIFRVSGSVSEMANYKTLFENGEDPLQDKMDGDDINTVAGLLKLYFRELKQPLFTFDLYDPLIKCSQTVYASTAVTSSSAAGGAGSSAGGAGSSAGGGGGESTTVEVVDWKGMLSKLLSTLSRERITIMRFLFSFLNHVTEHSDENMMEAFNLSICFGPTLLYAPPARTDQHQFQNYVNDLIKNIIVCHDELFPPPTQQDYDNSAVYEKYYVYDKDYLDSMSDEDGLKDHLAEEDDDLDRHEALVNDDYRSQSERELSVSRGDIVQLLGREGDYWTVEVAGRTGLLPDRILTYGKGGTLFRHTKATRDKSCDFLHQSNSSLHKSSSHSNLLTHSDDTSGNQSRASVDSSNQKSTSSPTANESPPLQWQQQQQQQLLVAVLPPLPHSNFRSRLNSASPVHHSSSQNSPTIHPSTHPSIHHSSPTSELDIQVSPPTSSLDIHHPSPSSTHKKFSKGNEEDDDDEDVDVDDDDDDDDGEKDDYASGRSLRVDETTSLGRASFNMKLLPSNQRHTTTASTITSKCRSLPHGATPPGSKSQSSFRSSHQSSAVATAVSAAAFAAAANSPTTAKTTLGSSYSLNNNLFRHQQQPPPPTSATPITLASAAAATLPRINEKLSGPPATMTKPVIRKRVSAEGLLSSKPSYSKSTPTTTTTITVTTITVTTTTTTTTTTPNATHSPLTIHASLTSPPSTSHPPLTATTSVLEESLSVKPSKIFQNVQQQKLMQKQQPQQQQPQQPQQPQQQQSQQPTSIDLTPGSTFNYKKTSTSLTSNNNNNNNNTATTTTATSSNNKSNTFKTIDNSNLSPNEGFNNSERNQFSSFKIASKK